MDAELIETQLPPTSAARNDDGRRSGGDRAHLTRLLGLPSRLKSRCYACSIR